MELSNATPLLTNLFHSGVKKSYNREEPICDSTSTDGLYMVAKGYVKRFEIMDNGAINVQSVYGPGDIFSITYIYELLLNKKIYNGPETFYYEGLGPTKVFKLAGSELIAAAQEEPLIYKEILLLAGSRFLSNIQMLENQSLPTAERRVAHILLFYAQRFGITRNGGTYLTAPLTQQDLADILSLTRETVSLAFSSLKQKGIIKKSRTVIIPEIKRLHDIAHTSDSQQ